MAHAHTDDLLSRARAWVAEDPDPQTRDELSAMLAAAEGPTPSPASGSPGPGWPNGSPAVSSSAPPGCAANSAPVRCG
ncbi:hypothetical protein GCM10025734_35960 [Kitasatospora paranensis]